MTSKSIVFVDLYGVDLYGVDVIELFSFVLVALLSKSRSYMLLVLLDYFAFVLVILIRISFVSSMISTPI